MNSQPDRARRPDRSDRASPPPAGRPDSEPSASLQSCIDLCSRCADVCTQTMVGCLGKGAEHAQADHIRLLADCADICRTSAAFMARGSPLHPSICRACAEVCARCAESCERIGPGDPDMQACARSCRACAESCAQMAATD